MSDTADKVIYFLKQSPEENASLLYIEATENRDLYSVGTLDEVQGVAIDWLGDPTVDHYTHVRAIDSRSCREVLNTIKHFPHVNSKYYVPVEFASEAREILGLDGLTEAEMVINIRPTIDISKRTEIHQNLSEELLYDLDGLFRHHPDHERRMAVVRMDKNNPAAVSLENGKPVSFANVTMFYGNVYRLSNIFTHPQKRGRGHAKSSIGALTKYLFDEMDATGVHAYSAEINNAAIGSFKSVGFAPKRRFLKLPVIKWIEEDANGSGEYDRTENMV